MVEKTHTAAGHDAGWLQHAYEPIRGLGEKIAGFFAPTAEAATTENAYEINLELPGVAIDDIDVAVHDNNLTIKGEKRGHHEEKGRTYFFSERHYGAFQRSFRLPPGIDADEIAATFADGVLTVSVPKTAARPDAMKKIEIHAGYA